MMSSSPTTSGEGMLGAPFVSCQSISAPVPSAASLTASSRGWLKLVLMNTRPWAATGRGMTENPSSP